ncbi:MAG: GNAT family N-acetyltransferase [Anaerolineales bacterium]
MTRAPAYRIETERLVIRCWDPRDAPLLDTAISSSLDHLKPWMPWAHEEPKSMEGRIDLLREFRGKFDLGEDFIYGILNVEESEVVGGTGLHTRRGKHIREIGYWIRADLVRKGFATESTAALVRVAFEIDEVRRVEIRCDPKNEASAAIPRKLGFAKEGTLRGKGEFLGTARDTEVWSLVAEEYPSNPSSQTRIKAFDAVGQLLLQ